VYVFVICKVLRKALRRLAAEVMDGAASIRRQYKGTVKGLNGCLDLAQCSLAAESAEFFVFCQKTCQAAKIDYSVKSGR